MVLAPSHIGHIRAKEDRQTDIDFNTKSRRIEELSSLGTESRKLGWENEDETLMLKMSILLYADDATI